MFATALIAFREFLEAFIIIGMFLGLSKQLDLKKEPEILLAAGLGIAISLILPIIVYLSGDQLRSVLTEDRIDVLQGALTVFAGFFLAYVTISLHRLFGRERNQQLAAAKAQLTANTFDVSLFFTVFLFIVREGFEIAVFTAAISFFAGFAQNLIGLLLGFAVSAVVGFVAYSAYITVPVNKIFKYTEYLILFVGAALVKNGISKLFDHGLHIDLGAILPIPLNFLPATDASWLAHSLKNLIGIEREFSLVKLAIMAVYLVLVWWLVNRPRPITPTVSIGK